MRQHLVALACSVGLFLSLGASAIHVLRYQTFQEQLAAPTKPDQATTQSDRVIDSLLRALRTDALENAIAFGSMAVLFGVVLVHLRRRTDAR